MSNNRSELPSLKDQRKIVNGRVYRIGSELSFEFGQHNPFFFTRELAEHPGLVGSFSGSSAFLIGSGPSFKEIN